MKEMSPPRAPSGSLYKAPQSKSRSGRPQVRRVQCGAGSTPSPGPMGLTCPVLSVSIGRFVIPGRHHELPRALDSVLDQIRGMPAPRQSYSVLAIDDDAALRGRRSPLLGDHYRDLIYSSTKEEVCAIGKDARAAVLDVKMPGRDGPWYAPRFTRSPRCARSSVDVAGTSPPACQMSEEGPPLENQVRSAERRMCATRYASQKLE